MSMVGGRVIEVLPMCLENGRAVIRLWCVEGSDECAVYSEPYESGAGPKVGDNISGARCARSGYLLIQGRSEAVNRVGAAERKICRLCGRAGTNSSPRIT